MTMTRPLRRRTLQSLQRFLTEARTFILVAVDQSSFGKVVRSHFDFHAVTRHDADVKHSQLACQMGQNLVAVFQLDSEGAGWQGLKDLAIDMQEVLLLFRFNRWLHRLYVWILFLALRSIRWHRVSAKWRTVLYFWRKRHKIPCLGTSLEILGF